ncbi:MAG: EAL domain-containing protein [Candidatus Anstonellales archaeon]
MGIGNYNLDVYVQPINEIKQQVTRYYELFLKPLEINIMSLIEILNKTGECVNFDLYALKTAGLIVNKYNKRITVNLCVNTLLLHRFYVYVYNELMNLNTDFSKIILEINENTSIYSPNVYDNIVNLKRLGFKLALDDFTFSNNQLELISSIGIDMLKVDKSYLSDINKLLGIKYMIDGLNKDNVVTVIEGIETINHLYIANKFNFRYVQGYLLGKPDRYDRYLTSNK